MEYLTKYLKDSITIAYIFFLETNSVILDLQFVGNFDSGNFACGIFVDLQKAFDTADHVFQMPDKMSNTIKYSPDILKIHRTSCQLFYNLSDLKIIRLRW